MTMPYDSHWPGDSVTLIVPCYNEEESIDQLRDRLVPTIEALAREARVQLILVDDGSTDTTFERLHAAFGRAGIGHCEILQHMENRGIAAAMRTGFKAATGRIVCTLDCDCSYAPEELAGMIRRLRECHADIVTASPYHPAVLDSETSHRLLLSRACSILYRLLAPEKLYCYTSFFRVYRREWARPELFFSDGFLGVTEILLSAAYCGARIEEYPTALGTRRFGRSKMRTMQVIRQHLTLLAQTMLLNTGLFLAGVLRRRTPRPEPLYALGEPYETELNRLDLVRRLRPGPKPSDEPVEDDLRIENVPAL